ncbi:MAG TPA: DUF4105 domain-containing protein [Gemmatimonadaceae bacterium]|jgi:hypothetical protein|nr:DUF4105 domain-containing protein [Gemmatimonadaceae bacterium]
MKPRTLYAVASFTCGLAGSLAAQIAPVAPVGPPASSTAPATVASPEPGSNLTVYVLTFGWGEAVWERFGHNAIWINDRTRGNDLTYNWGMFDFNQPHFIWRFVTGDTRYWMEPIEYNSMVQFYKSQNRSILAQELNLTPAQRLKLAQFLQWNALPQNKFYRYDYYRDNCSTRLRDALDHALGGQLQTATVSRKTEGTYRSHTQRLMTGDIPLYTGVTLALGHPADKPLSMWEEMFLPVRMANDLRSVTVADTGDIRVPLVKSERVIYTAGRSPEPAAPPNYFWLFVAAGIIYAVMLVFLVRRAEGGSRVALFGATALSMLWSLVAGAAGVALIFAWLFTKHYFMGRNENLLHMDPLSLGMVVLIPLSIYWLRASSRALKLAAWIAVICLVGLVIQSLPLFHQKNGEIIALALPINLAVWWTVYRLTSYRRTSLPSSAAL